jgi:cytosine/adenosine deaminase-related metal-dependent hydrolase
VGSHADVILLSLPDVEGVPSGHSLVDVLLKRGRGLHVRTVLIGGRLFIEDGRWTDRSAAQVLEQLQADAHSAPPKPAPVVAQLKDVVRRHLRTY